MLLEMRLFNWTQEVNMNTQDKLRDAVRDRYASIARTHRTSKEAASCCGSDCGGTTADPISSNLYTAEDLSGVPGEAALASLGCGNPTALAELRAGEVVLDLGSGAGLDVLLSARRVGPSGKAYGLDMTDEMLEIARENQRKAGVANVEFLRGEIEAIPLPDGTVDVVVSNCVINLSTEKPRALAEAYRVLKPGGRFAVSDIVARRELPESIRRDVEMWAGCLAGAIEENQYKALLRAAGFERIEVEPTRVYTSDDLCTGPTRVSKDAKTAEGLFMSAFIRATKPLR
jgi:SAM-dependent methyltransferase